MKPNALGQLRILHFPGAIGTAPRRAAAFGRLIVPGTAAHGMGIRLSRLVPRISHHSRPGTLLVELGIILVQDPFDYVAIHIAQAPGVRLFLAYFLIFELAVLLEPRVLRKFAGIIAEEINVSGAGAAS